MLAYRRRINIQMATVSQAEKAAFLTVTLINSLSSLHRLAAHLYKVQKELS